jgi:hypothetical protein
MVWIMENDPRAIIAVNSLEDDRLAQYLLEFIALGTWAGKPFVVPVPLRTPHARTRLRTLFLPGSGIETARAERVLMSAVHDNRPAMRENAVHILGIIGNPEVVPILSQALNDPAPTVRIQAAKALGRVGDPSAVPTLLTALRGADEQFGSQIFSALVQLGHDAVPALVNASKSNSAWVRWQCLRALGEIRDRRALPVLVPALGDTDHSIAWVAAKGLVRLGTIGVGPVLRLLTTAEITPWLIQTASYVLQHQRDPRLKPYLEPVIQAMHGAAFRVGTPDTAHRALTKLIADGLIESE